MQPNRETSPLPRQPDNCGWHKSGLAPRLGCKAAPVSDDQNEMFSEANSARPGWL